MPAFRITWTQTTVAAATVEIELDELASFAADSGIVHTLSDTGDTIPPDSSQLLRTIARNPHLRDALLRLWVTHGG